MKEVYAQIASGTWLKMMFHQKQHQHLSSSCTPVRVVYDRQHPIDPEAEFRIPQDEPALLKYQEMDSPVMTRDSFQAGHRH